MPGLSLSNISSQVKDPYDLLSVERVDNDLLFLYRNGTKYTIDEKKLIGIIKFATTPEQQQNTKIVAIKEIRRLSKKIFPEIEEGAEKDDERMSLMCCKETLSTLSTLYDEETQLNHIITDKNEAFIYG